MQPPLDPSSPDCDWNRVKGAGRLVIIGIDNGPGQRRNAAWAKVFSDLRAAGTVVLGYTYTKEGRRTQSAVKTAINNYYAWYNVSGIFLDEGSNSCAKVSYYRNLVSHVSRKGQQARKPSVVALNWGFMGSAASECYLTGSNAPDIIVNYEGYYSDYVKMDWGAEAPAWINKYPASRFWQIVHTVPAGGTAADTRARFVDVLEMSRQRRAGWVYVTNEVFSTAGGDPYDKLPPTDLWSLEVDGTSNGACMPS